MSLHKRFALHFVLQIHRYSNGCLIRLLLQYLQRVSIDYFLSIQITSQIPPPENQNTKTDTQTDKRTTSTISAGWQAGSPASSSIQLMIVRRKKLQYESYIRPYTIVDIWDRRTRHHANRRRRLCSCRSVQCAGILTSYRVRQHPTPADGWFTVIHWLQGDTIHI